MPRQSRSRPAGCSRAREGVIAHVLVQQDGQLWIGGSFLTTIRHAHSHIARLNADGTADLSFADPDHAFGNGFE